MSLSKQLKKQTTRVAGKESPTMKSSSSSEAKPASKSSRRPQSPDRRQPLPDSGFFDGSDGELYGDTGNNTVSYQYGNEKDWVLFGDDSVLSEDEDCYFNPEDAIDIASTKASYGGSTCNVKNNEDKKLAAAQAESSYPAFQIAHQSPQSIAPSHYYTYHPMTKPSTSQLDTWSRTPEQHELVAYRFEQPPNPAYAYHDVQQWHEDIDLDVYAVLF